MATRRRLDSATEINKLSSGDGGYDFKRLAYPSDNLGTEEIPSYIIFYINLPETSQLIKSGSVRTGLGDSTSDRQSALTRGRSGVFTPIGEGDFGDVVTSAAILTTLKNGVKDFADLDNRLAESVGVGVLNTIAHRIQKKPKYNRISRAIALYMPDTVFQTYTHDYDALSVTKATGLAGMAQRGGSDLNKNGGSSIKNFMNYVTGGPDSPAGKELGGFAAEQTGIVNQGFTDLVLRSSGLALNPQIEMVYKQTQNRQFTFDFKMQPRDSAESDIIRNIIKNFKMYSAPALVDGTGGAYFEIPGQFDIEFMFKNEMNPFIGKISTCVLQNIDVNYSSAGQFATFSDGSPVEINLQLRFIEVDTLTRDMFDKASF